MSTDRDAIQEDRPAIPRWRAALTREEIAGLLAVRDAWAWFSILFNWGIIGAAFAIVAAWPNPLSILLALFLIGGRQLGMAILMHDAAHRVLLKHRFWNDWVGNWLCAYPVWNDLHPYRTYHLKHHTKTWTEEDPDLELATPFPISRASLRRKMWRDLSGQTGWKRFLAILNRDLGNSKGRVRRDFGAGLQALKGVLVTNGILLGLLAAFGHAEFYLLWIAAWFTTYSLVMRIRSIAEHAMVPDPKNEMQNTRTTLIHWWERLFIAPNHVNFHLEHHLLMTVPHYNLPRLHRWLRERSVLTEACISEGYLSVLQLAASKA
ncbi:MAG: fatty acid desaturase family protein [Candidatus Binatia bacterium]